MICAYLRAGTGELACRAPDFIVIPRSFWHASWPSGALGTDAGYAAETVARPAEPHGANQTRQVTEPLPRSDLTAAGNGPQGTQQPSRAA